MSIGQGWAKGLTKETSKGIAARADKMRGRTKENNSGVAKSAAMRTNAVRENSYMNIVLPSESKGKCIVCGKKELLGDFLCRKCWDTKVERIDRNERNVGN